MATILACSLAAGAQTNMAGREYYNVDITKKEMEDITKKTAESIDKAEKEAIAKAKEKKGRDLTDEEVKEIKKEVEEGRKMLEALSKAMSTAITVTFKDEKNVVMNVDMKIDEEKLKIAGIGWAKRKMIKAATGMMPSLKSTYHVEGNLIIIEDREEPDTMSLSNDGKYLYGKMDKKKEFTLTRTK